MDQGPASVSGRRWFTGTPPHPASTRRSSDQLIARESLLPGGGGVARRSPCAAREAYGASDLRGQVVARSGTLSQPANLGGIQPPIPAGLSRAARETRARAWQYGPLRSLRASLRSARLESGGVASTRAGQVGSPASGYRIPSARPHTLADGPGPHPGASSVDAAGCARHPDSARPAVRGQPDRLLPGRSCPRIRRASGDQCRRTGVARRSGRHFAERNLAPIPGVPVARGSNAVAGGGP